MGPRVAVTGCNGYRPAIPHWRTLARTRAHPGLAASSAGGILRRRSGRLSAGWGDHRNDFNALTEPEAEDAGNAPKMPEKVSHGPVPPCFYALSILAPSGPTLIGSGTFSGGL